MPAQFQQCFVTETKKVDLFGHMKIDFIMLC